ncbi:MAG: lipoyl protein ligase domain-containing protein [Verrucomicrobiales bacterium]
MTWFLSEDGAGSAAWNMAYDEAMLIHAANFAAPLLRFYSWSEPAATFGYFQPYQQIESWTTLRPLVRRPTGGGLVPHDADWTYSLVAPPGHWWYELRAEESYKLLHTWISHAFALSRIETILAPCCSKELPGRCFAGPEKFDLLHDGKKIAGAAQRRNKLGLLIQGSVQNPPAGSTREQWQRAMIECGKDYLKGEPKSFEAGEAFLCEVEQLSKTKYAMQEYNQKR